MFNDEQSATYIKQLTNELKEYLGLQKRYVQLEATEKLTILLSTLIVLLLAVVLSLVALFYLSFALVYVLAPMVGGLTASYALIAGFHLLLLLLLLSFRRRLVVQPLARLIARLLLSNPTDENKPS